MKDLDEIVRSIEIGGITLVVDESLDYRINEELVYKFSRTYENLWAAAFTSAHPKWCSLLSEMITAKTSEQDVLVLGITEPTFFLALETWIRARKLVEHAHIYIFRQDEPNSDIACEEVLFDELWRIYRSFVDPFTELKGRRAAIIDEQEETR